MSCSWRTRCYSEALAKESYKSIIRHSESRRGDESQMTVIEIHRSALNDDKLVNLLPSHNIYPFKKDKGCIQYPSPRARVRKEAGIC